MRRDFVTDLSPEGVRKVIKELNEYKMQLQAKIDKATMRLAEVGLENATLNVLDMDAVDTGELVASLDIKRGDLIQYGSEWLVYTNCPWAEYVEFGTGAVGRNGPHPTSEEHGWQYDVNEHGDNGWWYMKDDGWHWTAGMESRPYMYETAMQLRLRAAAIITEVFNES